MKGILTFSQLGRYGRFANGVFQVASTIGIARKQGFKFEFPLWINHDHRDRFGSTEDVDIYKHLANELPLSDGRPFPERYYQWGYHEVQLPMGNWDLLGHLQSDKYFRSHIDEVRHYLTFKDEPPQNDYVAIHYRAGDYIDDPNAYHPRCPKEYYVEAMKLFPGRRFLLFSDDHAAWVRMTGVENISMMPGQDYIYDFKLMKSCHSFIIANSSYSLAAAILANQPGKQIVCPKKWFGDVAGMTWNDIYPENSIVI